MASTRTNTATGSGTWGATLAPLLDLAFARLRDLAADAPRFHQVMADAFGSAGTAATTFRSASEALRLDLLGGGDLGLHWSLRDSATLGGGRAAFAAIGPDGAPTILVNADWLAGVDAATAGRVMLEEIGHALDHRLNGSLDSRGDEGELFAALATNTDLDDAARSAILRDDDHGKLVVDDVPLAVEFSIDGGAVTGAADGYLNASELSGGLVITGISKLAGTGTSFLVALFTSSSATAPIFWQKGSATALSTDATTVTLTITTASLNNYSGPLFIRIYQGSSSGTGTSAAITGSTVALPTASSFSVNSALNGTALTTANTTTAAGQLTIGLLTIDRSASAPTALDLITASDTRTSTTDHITNDDTPTINGTGAEAGATVTLYDTDGTTELGTAIADGAGAWSITSSPLADGAHTLKAKQTDLAGNVSAASTALSVTIDTVAPSTTPSVPNLTAASDSGASNADDITNVATPVINGSGATPGAPVYLVDTDGVTVVGWAIANASGIWSITTSALSQGAHTLTARQGDTAGNMGPASTPLVVTIDTTAAAPSLPDLLAASDTGSSATDHITSDTTATFSGTGAEVGATVTLYDTNGTTVLGTATADGAGAWTITTTVLSVGAHTITAKQTDKAGNVSAASSAQAVTIDTAAAAPGTPDLATASDSGASSTDNITSAVTPTITGTGAEAGATVTLFDTDGVTVLGTATVDGSGAWSIVTTTLAEGAHTLKARQADLAGNTSTLSTGLAVTIDTQAPATLGAPDLDATSDTGASSTDDNTGDTTPTVSGTGAVAGATVTLYGTDGVTSLGTGVADGTGKWSITSSVLADGQHSLTARQTDTAGNVSDASPTLKITIDTRPQAMDLATASDTGPSTSDNITNVATPTITGTGATASAAISVYDSDGTTIIGSGTADGSGNWSIKTNTLTNGKHILTWKQAGGIASQPLEVTIDTAVVPPEAPDLSPLSDTGISIVDNITSLVQPTIMGGGAEAGATVTLYDTDGTTSLGTATADGAGFWSIATSKLAEGAHTITAKQTDLAGNVSVTQGSLAITVDTTAPSAPGTPDLAAASDSGASSTDNVTNRTTPTFSGSGVEAGATITLYDTDGIRVLGSAVANAQGKWNIVSLTLAEGTHSITARQTDKAGNTGDASTALSVTIDTQAPVAPPPGDAASPTDTGISNTDNITSKTEPSIRGVGAEVGATVTLLQNAVAIGSGSVNATGVWNVTPTTLAAGTYQFSARQTDKAGNTSAASGVSVFTVDTTVAALPAPDLAATSDTGPSNSDNITAATLPLITGTGAEAGATVTLYDTDGVTVLGTTTAEANGTWQIVTSALSAGTHSLKAVQTDKAGNVATASPVLDVTIDTTAPAASGAPALATASDTGASNSDLVTSKTTPTFTGTGAEAGATVTLFGTDRATVLGSAIADGAGAWSVTSLALAAGRHTVTTRVTDKAGNAGTFSAGTTIVVDTTAATLAAPDLVATSDLGALATDNLTSTTNPFLAGSGAEAGATIALYASNGTVLLGTTTAQADGTWLMGATLAAGAHGLSVRQTDLAGNTSAGSQALGVTIDATAPGAPSTPDLTNASDTGASVTDNLTSKATPTVSGNGAEVSATVTLYDTDGITVLGSVIADGLGAWSITTAPLAAGAHTLTARQTDRAGNTGPASAGLQVTIDATVAPTTAPDLAAASDSGALTTDDVTSKTTPVVSGQAAEAGATVTLYATNGTSVLGTTTADAAGLWSITSAALSAGVHVLTTKQTDKAGNVSAPSAGLTLTIDTSATAPTGLDLVAGSDTGASATDNSTDDVTPTIIGTGAEAGATVTLHDTNGTTVLGTTTVGSAGAWSITSTTLTAGAHTLTARQTDAAGNTSAASAALVVTIAAVGSTLLAPQLAAASDSGTSSSDGVTLVTTPVFNGTGVTAGQTVTLYDTNGTTILGTAIADTGGAWSITTAPLSAGTHVVFARQGATQVSAERVVIIDTSAGALAAPDLVAEHDSGASATDNVTVVQTPVLAGTGAEAGATVTLFDTDGVTVLGVTTASAQGRWTIIAGSLAEGTHTLTARQTDIAGNGSAASAPLVVTVDTTVTAPGTPDLAEAWDTGALATDNLTNKAAPTVTGTGAEAGATVLLLDTDGVSVLGRTVADGAGAWSVNSATLSPGTHMLAARQIDKAGNMGTLSATLAVTVDVLAPAAPPMPDLATASDSGTSSADNLTNATAPTITGAGVEAGATVTLYDTNGTTVLGTAVANASGVWSITSATLAPGAHSLTVRQTDLAGNVSAASLPLVVTIDTTTAALAAPDLATASDTGASGTDNLTARTTPTLTGVGAEAGATVTLYDTNGTKVLGTAKADAAGGWSITSSTLAAGAHTLTARQTDRAGNLSVASPGLVVTIDATVGTPGTPDLVTASDTGASGTDNLTQLTTPTFGGTGVEAGATVTLYDTNGVTTIGSGTADAAGAWSVTTSALAAGRHRVTARQTDKAGNVSAASNGLWVTIDPTAAALSAPDLIAAADTGVLNSDNLTTLTGVTVTGSKAESGATVTLYDSDGTTALGSVAADGAGLWQITTTALSEGTHQLTARQLDKAGNTSVASAALAVTVDLTAPDAPGAPDLYDGSDTGSSISDNITRNTSLTLTGGSAEAGATVTLYDTDGTTALGSATAAAGGTWSITTVTLGQGKHTLTARQTDKAGNTGAASIGLDVTVDTTLPALTLAPDLAAASDTGASASDDITSDSTPTFSGTGAEAGATLTLTDVTAGGSTKLGTVTVAVDGTWSITTPALADGVHVLTVSQVDAAGNVGPASPTRTITVDTAVSAPAILAVTTTTISGAVAEGQSIALFDNGVALGTGLITGAPSWTAWIALAAGNHVLTATTTDTAGNTSAASAALLASIGTTGADTIAGTAGADMMVGGKGGDTYTVNHAGDLVEEETGEGTDIVNASVGYTLTNGSEIEFLYAVDPGSAGLVLAGNAGANTIVGAGGADTITGGGSADTLTGGGAADTFVYLALTDSTPDATDLITDFAIGAGDLINLAGLDANLSLAGDQAFSFIGTSAFSGEAGQLRYVQSGGNTQVLGDDDGDSSADFALLLTGTHTLTGAQFVL